MSKAMPILLMLLLALSLFSSSFASVKAAAEEGMENAKQGFSNVDTPAFIVANGKSFAVLHRVWSPKLKNWGTWELAEFCPYSRMRLGKDFETWGYAYSVSEAYFGVRYTRDGITFFEWSNDFPNIEYADYEPKAPVVNINMSAPVDPEIRLSWVFFASEEDDGVVWGAEVTNLASSRLSDVKLYFNFDALINNKRSDFVWHEDKLAYTIERRELGIYVGISSWTPPDVHHHGLNTKQMIYNDALRNTTGRANVDSCGFEWTLGTLQPNESSKKVFLFITLGNDAEDVLRKVQEAKRKPPSQHLEFTRDFWSEWLGKASFESPDPYLNRMFDLSLMFSLMGIHRPSGAVIACMDGAHWMRWGGERPYSRWEFHPYYLHVWIRDLIFFSMEFDLLGYVEEARNALLFARNVQNPDGSFYTNYEVDGSVANTAPDETDQTALYVYGLYLHYCATGNMSFLEETWESIRRACVFLMSRQSSKGLIYGQASIHEWPGVSEGYEAWTQACGYAALKSGARMALVLGHLSEASEWEDAAERLRIGTCVHLWNSTMGSFCQRLFNGKQFMWADVKMLAPSLFFIPILNASDPKMMRTYDFLVQRLDDPYIGGIWRYERDAGEPTVPEKYNGGYGPWFIYTCWSALNRMAAGRVDEALKWIDWCKTHATAQGLFSEHISTSEWHYLFQNPANATRSYYGIGTFGGWFALTLASLFIKLTDHSGLTLRPIIPSYWDSMNLTFMYRGTTFTLNVRGHGFIDEIAIDDRLVQSLRIPSEFCDKGRHVVSISLNPSLKSPYIEDAPLLNIRYSSYNSEYDALNLELDAPYLSDQSIRAVSAEEPIVVYVNGIPSPQSKSLNILFHHVGWTYNETERRLYLKVRGSANPLNVTMMFGHSLDVKIVDHYDGALGGSIVTVYWLNGTRIRSQQTDDEGMAHFHHLRGGIYKIRAEYKGIHYESTVAVEAPIVKFTAKLEIIGFLFGMPVTKLAADFMLIIMMTFVVGYIFRRPVGSLFRKARSLKGIKGLKSRGAMQV